MGRVADDASAWNANDLQIGEDSRVHHTNQPNQTRELTTRCAACSNPTHLEKRHGGWSTGWPHTHTTITANIPRTCGMRLSLQNAPIPMNTSEHHENWDFVRSHCVRLVATGRKVCSTLVNSPLQLQSARSARAALVLPTACRPGAASCASCLRTPT